MGKKAICLNCERKMNITGRGLCFTCYQKPEVRDQHPKKKPGGVRKAKAPAAAKPAAVEEVKLEPTETEKEKAIKILLEGGHDVVDVSVIINSFSNLLTADELVEAFLKMDTEPETEPVDDGLIEVDPATEYFDAVQGEPGEPVDADFEEVEELEPDDGPSILEVEIKTNRDVDIYEKIVELSAETRRTPGDWMLCVVEDYLTQIKELE